MNDCTYCASTSYRRKHAPGPVQCAFNPQHSRNRLCGTMLALRDLAERVNDVQHFGSERVGIIPVPGACLWPEPTRTPPGKRPTDGYVVLTWTENSPSVSSHAVIDLRGHHHLLDDAMAQRILAHYGTRASHAA